MWESINPIATSNAIWRERLTLKTWFSSRAASVDNLLSTGLLNCLPKLSYYFVITIHKWPKKRGFSVILWNNLLYRILWKMYRQNSVDTVSGFFGGKVEVLQFLKNMLYSMKECYQEWWEVGGRQSGGFCVVHFLAWTLIVIWVPSITNWVI